MFTYPAVPVEVGTDDEIEVACKVLKGMEYCQWARLRGITLAEGSPSYGPAIRFLQDLIDDPDEHFAVTLNKIEVVGRKNYDYDLLLADFFHLKGDVTYEEVAARGTFLNRELVERGLARMLG